MADPLASMPRDALVLLIGAAGAGKSTWAAARFRPHQVLSSDGFRELVADDPADQAASGDAFRILHAVARARLKRGLLTVIDATNLEASARRPLLLLATRFARPSVAVVFDVTLEVLLERNAARRRVVPEDVVRRQYRSVSGAVRALPMEGYSAILRG